jgi:hypothetical protein
MPRRLANHAFSQARRLLFFLRHRRAFGEIIARSRRAITPLAPLGSVRVVRSSRLMHKADAVYRREGGGYLLELSRFEALHYADKAGGLGPAYLYWLTQCPPEVTHISVTLSDGDKSSWAKYAPSSAQPHHVLLPDPYFFINRAYGWAADYARLNEIPWTERSSDLTWRGAAAGLGTFDPIVGTASPAIAAQRLILCLAARNIPDADAALVGYWRDEFREDVLNSYGLLREPIPEKSWVGRKFAIDVDGQTNTWTNLLVRLHFGCCVLKVDSRYGFRQWYYDRLVPWEHYVPVKADCSDLAEQVSWVRDHDREASEIAANGRAIARTLTFESERAVAVRLIAANWRGDDPYSPPRLGPGHLGRAGSLA